MTRGDIPRTLTARGRRCEYPARASERTRGGARLRHLSAMVSRLPTASAVFCAFSVLEAHFSAVSAVNALLRKLAWLIHSPMIQPII